MILSPLSRQQTALRICRPLMQTQCLYNPKTQRRRLHRLPQLAHHEAFTKDGVHGMLSADGYDMAWIQYQSHLVDRLNKLTAGIPSVASIHSTFFLVHQTPANINVQGTTYDSSTTQELILAHARKPDAASLFNHASMAWSNHQFFSTLSPSPPKMSPYLTTRISESFSSPESLRVTFIATANAMFGPGFVWLVRHKYRTSQESELSILTTYLAGSPLPGAHYRKQEVDHNTMMAAGSFGTTSLLPGKDSKIAYGGADLDILLGVNTWQHVWLMDWGIGGKKQFLEAWWEAVDWNVVEARWHATESKVMAETKKGDPLNRIKEVGRQGQRRVY